MAGVKAVLIGDVCIDHNASKGISYCKDFRNHSLKGEWIGHRSISIGGDLRLHYRELEPAAALFVAVGTHSQLYK